MAISQNSDRYFPEIIGMTLFLEWEVLELAWTIKKLDYHGIDSQFWRMHVGIDNAVDGHGAKARNAVNVYLDNVLKESGRAAMQREWQRIWTGFVAFATAGMNYSALTAWSLIAVRRGSDGQNQKPDGAQAALRQSEPRQQKDGRQPDQRLILTMQHIVTSLRTLPLSFRAIRRPAGC